MNSLKRTLEYLNRIQVEFFVSRVDGRLFASRALSEQEAKEIAEFETEILEVAAGKRCCYCGDRLDEHERLGHSVCLDCVLAGHGPEAPIENGMIRDRAS